MTEGESRRIPLSQGLEAIVDAEDYDKRMAEDARKRVAEERAA